MESKSNKSNKMINEEVAMMFVWQRNFFKEKGLHSLLGRTPIHESLCGWTPLDQFFEPGSLSGPASKRMLENIRLKKGEKKVEFESLTFSRIGAMFKGLSTKGVVAVKKNMLWGLEKPKEILSKAETLDNVSWAELVCACDVRLETFKRETWFSPRELYQYRVDLELLSVLKGFSIEVLVALNVSYEECLLLQADYVELDKIDNGSGLLKSLPLTKVEWSSLGAPPGFLSSETDIDEEIRKEGEGEGAWFINPLLGMKAIKPPKKKETVITTPSNHLPLQTEQRKQESVQRYINQDTSFANASYMHYPPSQPPPQPFPLRSDFLLQTAQSHYQQQQQQRYLHQQHQQPQYQTQLTPHLNPLNQQMRNIILKHAQRQPQYPHPSNG